MLLKKYQCYLLLHIWGNVTFDDPIGSGKAWEFMQTTDDKKSRASVIFFLNDMIDEGVLGWHDRTGKGGHHRLYYPLMTEKQFWEHVARKVYAKIVEASGDPNVFAFKGIILEED
ncbi:hypothetical protein ES702_04499 [subsurface metagenome]